MTDVDTRGHNAPCSNHDFDFFYRGLERGRLLVQQCSGCGKLRSLPTVCCDACHSLDWNEFELSGEGTVFSYVVHHHPPLPGLSVPHPIALVEMREGVRMMGAMDGTEIGENAIGTPVTAEFLRRGEVAAFRFRNV
jgi:uncharacterized OB-fold protein